MLLSTNPRLDPSGRLCRCALLAACPSGTDLDSDPRPCDRRRAHPRHPSHGRECVGQRGTIGEAYAAPAWLPDGRLVTDGAAGSGSGISPTARAASCGPSDSPRPRQPVSWWWRVRCKEHPEPPMGRTGGNHLLALGVRPRVERDAGDQVARQQDHDARPRPSRRDPRDRRHERRCSESARSPVGSRTCCSATPAK